MEISNLSVEEKIGQLMMFGFYGKSPSKEIIELIKKYKVGGIILFNHNIDKAKDVSKLTLELQLAAKEANHSYPLFISIDQENGIVRRLKDGTTTFPGNMLLGATGDATLTKEIAYLTAMDLKELGINMNLVPVLDVNNNPYNPVIGVRSFGEKVEEVIKHGIAVIQGHHRGKVMTSAKHFPGHGDTDIDSHLDLPVIPHKIERLRKLEFMPFVEAIKNHVDSIMISHVYFPGIDDTLDTPATLSKKIITEILREEMGYDGVVITDCLEMNAIAKTIGTVEAAVLSLKAGADVFIVSHSSQLQKEMVERMLKAIQDGEIKEEILNKAVARIMKLKKRYLFWDDIMDLEKYRIVAMNDKNRSFSKHVYQKGITLVKNDGILPLRMEPSARITVIYPESKVYTMVEDMSNNSYAIEKYVKKYHDNFQVYRVSNPPTDSEISDIKSIVEKSDLTIIGTVNAHLIEKQALLVNELISIKKPVITIAMRNPYDFAMMPDVNAFIAAYEHSDFAIETAVDIIFGKINPKGKLPVSIPGYRNKGFSLSYD